MKLNENFDYLYLKERTQSKYDFKDYLTRIEKDSIKAILKLCEEQEKTINKLETEIKAMNCMHGGFTLNNEELKKYILKDRLNTIVYSQQLLSIQISDLRKEIEGDTYAK